VPAEVYEVTSSCGAVPLYVMTTVRVATYTTPYAALLSVCPRVSEISQKP
jgi:hypothetical protein